MNDVIILTATVTTLIIDGYVWGLTLAFTGRQPPKWSWLPFGGWLWSFLELLKHC